MNIKKEEEGQVISCPNCESRNVKLIDKGHCIHTRYVEEFWYKYKCNKCNHKFTKTE